MKLRYESEQNYRVWCHMLLRIAWLCLAVAVLAGVLHAGIHTGWGRAGDFGSLLLRNVLWPGLANALILAIIYLLLVIQIRKRQYVRHAFCYVFGVSVISASYVWIYADIPAMPAILVIPILLAIMYIDRRVLLWALLLNILQLGAFTLLAPRLLEGARVDTASIGVIATLLALAYLISIFVYKKQKELAEQVYHANRKARMDSLTGLYNHAVFYEHLDQYILRQKKKNRPFLLVIFDIDNFKKINDQYGHDTGDDVIRLLVECIRLLLPMDSQAFRYGGEEFALLVGGKLPGCASLVETVLANFRLEAIDRLGFPVTVSAGVCVYDPQVFNGRREFFSAADEALYAAKHRGKNCYVVWGGVQGR